MPLYTVKGAIKFIHVIRNPYDNISTICRKAKTHKLNPNLKDSIEYYFSLCETVTDIKKQIKSADIFELRHESFINTPKTCLKEICNFLGAIQITLLRGIYFFSWKKGDKDRPLKNLLLGWGIYAVIYLPWFLFWTQIPHPIENYPGMAVSSKLFEFESWTNLSRLLVFFSGMLDSKTWGFAWMVYSTFLISQEDFGWTHALVLAMKAG